MRDLMVVSFSPVHRWIEQKIRVHLFYCAVVCVATRLISVRPTEPA
jgi:hypothetical protein